MFDVFFFLLCVYLFSDIRSLYFFCSLLLFIPISFFRGSLKKQFNVRCLQWQYYHFQLLCEGVYIVECISYHFTHSVGGNVKETETFTWPQFLLGCFSIEGSQIMTKFNE